MLERTSYMKPKQIFHNQSPSPSSRYQSFIGKNLESFNWRGINKPRGRQIRACFHGWVILSKSNSRDVSLWSLWNPLTSELIHLPPLNYKKEDGHFFCLSSPPGDQGSFFLLSYKTPTIVFCQLDCKKKGLKWTEMSYVEQLRNISGIDDVQLVHPTCYNGKVYAMGVGRDLRYQFVIQVDIEVKGMEAVISLLQFVKIPRVYSHFPTRNSACFTFPFLKGSCKELFYIKVCFIDGERIGGVFLFKLDETSNVFEKMEDLKDAVFFVDTSTCSVFYRSVVASDIGGYVHVIDHFGKIYSFNVKDKTMSLSLMPCTLRESHVLVWAMLECRLEVDHRKSKQEGKDKDIKTKSVSKSESRLLNVPFHILEMIMEKCHGVEYMKFRATSKLCRLAAPPIQWSNKTALRKMQTYSVVSPWLMVLDNQGIFTFIDPIYGDKYFIKKPLQLNNDFKICYSMHGWLLLLDKSPIQIWFFNPFTSDIIQFPLIPFEFRSVCFSAPPTSPDCMVVGFTRHAVYISFVSQEPEPFWRRYYLDTGINDINSFPIPTLRGRDMYVLCNNERIEAFRNLGKEDFSRAVVVDKAPVSRCTSLREYFLTTYGQHILLVIVDEVEESVEVFKLNESTKEWEKINCLGKHMVYISYPSCFCLEAKSPKMENKIYFPRLLHNEGKMVFYSLETCKYHTFDDKNNQESFGVYLSETVRPSCPNTWIEPSWS